MSRKKSFITVTDQFCGAGGSSIGATKAGAELRLALNHWQLAIDTHQSNFPHSDHDCTDISACDPRRYPSTDILITSPECTNHTLAKGVARRRQSQLNMFGGVIDPAEERSRATMWDVPRFAEYHHYRMIVVENVIEARWWVMWDAWLHAMDLLGYAHQCVYLNSMHAHPLPRCRPDADRPRARAAGPRPQPAPGQVDNGTDSRGWGHRATSPPFFPPALNKSAKMRPGEGRNGQKGGAEQMCNLGWGY